MEWLQKSIGDAPVLGCIHEKFVLEGSLMDYSARFSRAPCRQSFETLIYQVWYGDVLVASIGPEDDPPNDETKPAARLFIFYKNLPDEANSRYRPLTKCYFYSCAMGDCRFYISASMLVLRRIEGNYCMEQRAKYVKSVG